MTITVTLDCGHLHDYTGLRTMPQTGEVAPCWSSCDHVPTGRPASPRHIVKIETQED